MRKTKLSRILLYKNPEIVARFSRDLGLPKKTSEVIFKDMLRFLWLLKRAETLKHSQTKRSIPEVNILEPMLIIDEMWHTFVLYTSEYTQFSRKYFGEFMHHAPTPVLQSKSPRSKSPVRAAGRVSERELDQLIEFVWDELGPEVAIRWFKTFPSKYTRKKIRRRQLRSAES